MDAKMEVVKRNKETIRRIGAYYTPDIVAEAILKWAIKSKDDLIMDPSFGGCQFLVKSRQILDQLGSNSSGDQLYGYDIDHFAEKYLQDLIEMKYSKRQFVFGDFLASKANRKFDAVVGNPPYIKHDNIPKHLLEVAELILKEYGLKVSKPNYWMYFLLHSLKFIKKGGRMAFVLPLSFNRAAYAKDIRKILCNKFKKVSLIPLVDDIFEGTEEKTLILLCEYYISSKDNIGEYTVSNPVASKDLIIAIDGLANTTKRQPASVHYASPIVSDARDLIGHVAEQGQLIRLGDIFDIKIGVVTGNKEYFIFDEERVRDSKIPREFFTPVVSRGLEVDLSSFVSHSQKYENPLFLLNVPRNYEIHALYSNEYLDSYLLSAPDVVRRSYHCMHRKPWYHVPRVYSPDAVIKNISTHYSIIYPNPYNATFTNNFIRLNSLSKRNDTNMYGIFSMTSLYQLYIESHAINYGRDSIKVDPGVLMGAIVPQGFDISLSEIEKIEKLISEGIRFDSIREIVDKIFLNRIGSLGKWEIREIKRMYTQMKRLRKQISI